MLCELTPITLFNSPEEYFSGDLRKADGEEWLSWKTENIIPDPFSRMPAMDLNFRAKIYIQDFSIKGSVMVDTGSRLPILFRSKFIPTKFLTKAEIPARIVTADNSPMQEALSVAT